MASYSLSDCPAGHSCVETNSISSASTSRMFMVYALTWLYNRVKSQRQTSLRRDCGEIWAAAGMGLASSERSALSAGVVSIIVSVPSSCNIYGGFIILYNSSCLTRSTCAGSISTQRGLGCTLNGINELARTIAGLAMINAAPRMNARLLGTISSAAIGVHSQLFYSTIHKYNRYGVQSQALFLLNSQCSVPHT